VNDPSRAPLGGTEARVRAAHRQATIIVGAMTASLFVYAAVVEIIGRTAAVGSGAEPPEVIRWAFYAIAVSMVFTSHVAKAFMLRGFQARTVDEILARLTTANVVTAAIAEAPAVLGFVLFFLSPRFYSDFYILEVISLYLLVRHFPRYDNWERVIRQHAPHAS
jgi:hypothetical protein